MDRASRAAIPEGGRVSPLVSVVIATRDRPDYLRLALSSALAQTHEAIEILVSDDAGTCDPRPIVEQFADPRVTVTRNQTQLGIAGNVASAMKRARGDYIANLHDDDEWTPEFLEKLVPALEEHPDAVLAFSDYAVIDPEGRIDERATARQSAAEHRSDLAAGLHRPFHRMGIERGSVFLAGAAVFRNGVLDWDEIADVGVLWDRYSVYALARTGRGAVFVPGRLTRYREHPGTETLSCGTDPDAKLRKAESGIICATRMLADDSIRDSHPWIRRWLAEHHTSKAIALLRKGTREGVLTAAWQGWRRQPSLRSSAALALAVLPRRLSSALASMPRGRRPHLTTAGPSV